MFTFPTNLFNPANIKLAPAGRTISGGESLLGETDVIRTDGGGYWVVAFAGIDLLSRDEIRAWEAWESHLAGGVQRCLVPVPSLLTAPRPTAGGRLAMPSALVPTSEDRCFPEALAFAAPLIVAKVTSAAALRATTIVINIEQGARLQGGERFAVNHPAKGRRMYRVERVTARSGQQATCIVWPPMREAIAANTAADFDWPSFVATLVPDSDISPDIGMGDDATVEVTFREAS